ncbi:MAG TPA: hypothetical protein VNO14_16045 [Blastocatellia bacterium]|nr:hypothetical protein [Blastocatellia bacterium]
MAGRIKRITLSALVAALAIYGSGCRDSGEQEAYAELAAIEARARSIDPRTSAASSINALQELIDAQARFLEDYPDSQYFADVRARQDKILQELNALREEVAQYEQLKKQEIDEGRPQLPSDCKRMAKQWQDFITRFPTSALTPQAQERQRRWEAKHQEEIKRGFQIIIEGAVVDRLKGPSHGLMAGRPWDPEVFEAQSAPDPYVIVLVDGQVFEQTHVAKDSFKAAWNQLTKVLQVSDENEVTILLRDRDVAEKAAIALMGKSLFTYGGVQAARQALKEDNDDDIGKWTGTLHELMKRGKDRFRIGDSGELWLRVVRPR